MMQFTAQSFNALFHTMHLSIFVSCLITAFSFVFSLCDAIFVWPNGPTCFCSVHPMDHSRNQNDFATTVSSALLCDSQIAQKFFIMSFNRYQREKKIVVGDFCLYLVPTEAVQPLGYLAPRWAQGKLFCASPSLIKKGSSLSLAWLVLPLLGIPKPRLSLCQFLWFFGSFFDDIFFFWRW